MALPGVLLGVCCYLFVAVSGSGADDVTHATSDDVYMNPCKARSFLGDIALSEEDVSGIEKSVLQQRPQIELEIKKEMASWHRQRDEARRELKSFKEDLEVHCEQRGSHQAKRCSRLRQNVGLTRRRLRGIHQTIHDLKGKARQLKQLEEKPHSRRHRRAATAFQDRLWDYGVVPYVVGANFTGKTKALFTLAMRHWENHTCITFREKQPEDKNYITFTQQHCGCCSYVGKKGQGPQAISIGKNCDKFGIVVHELGHVIGFWHEHTRPDRDEHVKIMWTNIQEAQEYNFDKMTYTQINSLGEPYDYASIMHYSRNTFAKKSFSLLDTIVPKRKPGIAVVPDIGQRVALSEGDIQQANKLYKCTSCGKSLQESEGDFYHAPTRGEPGLCRWRISATHGEKIVLNVTMLDIPKVPDCRTDYLEVRDGHYIRSPLIGRFCGDTVPDTMESTGTRMWVEYRSWRGLGKGFLANYEAMCGGQISKDEGFLTSPNFPHDYRPHKRCSWKISVEEGHTVAFKFQSFGIEKHDMCAYDYLEIRDGPDESSPLIGNFCGYKTPADIQSTGKDLFVRFVSDGNVQKSGFSAIFVKEFDECSKPDHGCDQICENTLGSYKCSCQVGYELHTDGKKCQDACGGVIDSENGTIESPSYPDLYPPSKNCVWQIVAPADHKIHVNFTHFDLEGSNQDCEFDSVRVSSRVGTRLKAHGTFCGSSFPDPVTSTNNRLQIEFNSDNSVQKTGFTLVYQVDKDECSVDNGGCQHECMNTVGSYNCACRNGFTLHADGHGCKEGGCHHDITAPVGTTHSPNFPEDYPSRKDCVWHFSTKHGHRIRLTFKTFQLEPHQTCTYDHIALYDGPDKESPKMAKYCGAYIPKPVVSTGSHMFMTFFSDVSVERKGFEIEYDTVCGGDLQASTARQTLVSHPHYGDLNYDNRMSCTWNIRGEEGSLLVLEFNEINVENEYDCGYDFITISSVDKKKREQVLGLYCGLEVPPPIRSSAQSVKVQFQSDDTIVMKGFSLSYYYLESPGHDPTDEVNVNIV